MYILEVFIKWLNKRQTKEVIPQKPSFEEVDEALTCKHHFMPIDSTGLTLACTKCGFVVKKGMGN
jgi:PHP family Zn ribbon phosphoesterase